MLAGVMPVVPMVVNRVSSLTCRITRLVRGRGGWERRREGKGLRGGVIVRAD